MKIILQNKNFYKNSFKGFVLVELLIVLSVLVILLSTVIYQFSKMKEQQSLNSVVGDISSVLNKANSQTISSLKASEYGIYLESQKIVLFKGIAYDQNDPNNEVINISSPVSITNAILNTVDELPAELYFSRLTGVPSKTGTIIITTDSFSKVITIGANGQVSIGTNNFTFYSLSLNTPVGGSVTSNPGTIDCGTTCSNNFVSGTLVSLSANPSTGYSFTGWTGDCTGIGTCDITMNSNKNVVANFATATFPLNVSVVGNGIITSTPGTINCGATCSDDFDYNTSVALTATPTSCNAFLNWSGDCTGTGSCNPTMNGPKNIQANFFVPSSFPTIAGTNSSTQTTDVTSHTVNLPSSISSGNLLIVFFSVDGSNESITWPAGWTQLMKDYQGTNTFEIRYRVADGSEGSSIALTTGLVQKSAHQSFRITGYTSVLGIPQIAVVKTKATSLSPNSPALTPGWCNTKSLWISAIGRNAGSNSTNNLCPTNYLNPSTGVLGCWNTVSFSNSTGATVSTAIRQNEVSVEDPSAFGITLSDAWVAATIAVQGQ